MDRPHIEISQICEYSGHTGSIFAMAIDQDEHYLFTSGDDGIVARWDLRQQADKGSAVVRLPVAVYSLLYISSHRILVAGTSDGTVQFVDLESRKILHSHRKTADAVYFLHWESSRQQVWILQANGLLSAVSLPDFEEVFILKMSDENLRVAIPALEAGRLYIGASDKLITEIDISGPNRIRQWEAHNNSVFSLAIHPTGKYLLSGGRDAHLNSWDLMDNHASIRQIPAHNFTINDIVFSPDGDYFMTASRDKTLKLWDAYSFELLKVIDKARNDGHKHSVNKLRWLKSDNSVISVSDDRRIIRWRIAISPKATEYDHSN